MARLASLAPSASVARSASDVNVSSYSVLQSNLEGKRHQKTVARLLTRATIEKSAYSTETEAFMYAAEASMESDASFEAKAIQKAKAKVKVKDRKIAFEKAAANSEALSPSEVKDRWKPRELITGPTTSSRSPQLSQKYRLVR